MQLTTLVEVVDAVRWSGEETCGSDEWNQIEQWSGVLLEPMADGAVRAGFETVGPGDYLVRYRGESAELLVMSEEELRQRFREPTSLLVGHDLVSPTALS